MDEYESLVKQLNHYAYLYYVLDEPIVSDKEYDILYDRLVRLEKERGFVASDSPTRKVGGEPIKTFGTHRHLERLYSLDKAQTLDEVRAWYTRVTAGLGFSPKVTLEYKLDGLTLCLTYRDGSFERATTRGNGVEGEDVTAQVMTIRSLPLKISQGGVVEVQGEGVMRLSKFEQYNRTAEEPLKNARNGVAGAIRNLDPKVTAKRNLDIYFYNVNYNSNGKPSTQTAMIDWLVNEKFLTAPCLSFCSIDEVVHAIETVDRKKLDYLIDGMVIKVDDCDQRSVLGFTDKFPRWAIAFKFEAEETSTVLTDVEWNVGRTGKITPLAHLQPVELCGATISRATLNNLGDIRRKNVSIGDRVFIRRSNDVIPEIMGLAERGQASKPILPPDRCPGCGAELQTVGAHLYCVNPECPPQKIAMLEYFCSKDCMDISGVSSATATQLFYNLGIESPTQLYGLTCQDLLSLDGVKEKKAQKIVDAIAASRKVTLPKFIMALGISGIGKKTASDLAAVFETPQALSRATREELCKINEIGEVLADNILEYFATHSQEMQNLLDVLELTQTVKKGALVGKNFVLTGKLKGLTRGEATLLIESEGGTVLSSTTKNTDYVVAGEDAGSKLDRANKLGIPVLSEKDLLSLLQNK